MKKISRNKCEPWKVYTWHWSCRHYRFSSLYCRWNSSEYYFNWKLLFSIYFALNHNICFLWEIFHFRAPSPPLISHSVEYHPAPNLHMWITRSFATDRACMAKSLVPFGRFNLIYWQPKSACKIILYTRNWWTNRLIYCSKKLHALLYRNVGS